MSKRVRCVVPGRQSQVMLLGPHLTPRTFLLVARNLLTGTDCTQISLRYGTPPGYVTIPLREEGEESSTQPPLHISDHETVWIDVCPACRERMLSRQRCLTTADPPHTNTTSRKVTTLKDIQTSSAAESHFPPFSDRELGPGGYYYRTASRECRLDHLSVYVFSNAPHAQFLYSARLDTLIELPQQLTLLEKDRPVPREFMAPSGFLYRLLSAHTSMKHMNFYTLGILPGRILVYDAVLDTLTETHLTSTLTLSLFPHSHVSNNSLYSTAATLASVSPEDDCVSSRETLEEKAACTAVQCQRVATCVLESSTAPVRESSGGESAVRGRWTVQQQQSQHCGMHNTSTDSSLHTFQQKQQLQASSASRSLESSFVLAPPPAIHVYEPSSLDVSIAVTGLETRCHVPPCVYTGVDSDPR